MTDFTPWMRPTLYGPFVTTWGLATLLSLTQGFALVLPNGERIDNWVALLFSVSFYAAMVVVGLLAADLALLRAKLRKLPTGGRAWVSSLLAPIAVYVAWMIFGWGDEDSSIPAVVLSIAWPFVGAPLALRWIFGERS